MSLVKHFVTSSWNQTSPKLLLLDRVSAVNATDPLIAFRSPIPNQFKRASGARFFYCLLFGLIGHIQQNRVKNLSLAPLANLFPLSVSNVITAVECSALVLFKNPVSNFMAEMGGKRKWGRCSLKRMFWVGLTGVLGEGLTSLRLAPALVFCPPPLLSLSVFSHAASKTKSWLRHDYPRTTTVVWLPHLRFMIHDYVRVTNFLLLFLHIIITTTATSRPYGHWETMGNSMCHICAGKPSRPDA